MEIPGSVPLVFRRYYSTNLLGETAGSLGPGWTHNFALSLSRTSEGFRLRDQNGGVVDFPGPDDGQLGSRLNEAAGMELRSEGGALCVYHWHDWTTAVEKLWFARLPAGQFRLERISPPSGFGLALNYDAAGRLAGVAQMIEGRRIALSYNARGLVSALMVASSTSSPRAFASYVYDEYDRLTAVSDATGTPLRYMYDRQGRITREETRGGAVFRMRYDTVGRCVHTRGIDDYHACHLQYALEGRLTLVTDSLGSATVFEMNGSGQVVTERRPDGAVSSTRYDETGRIIEETDPLGRTTRYSYDGNGNTALVTYANGLTREVHYDRDHQPVSVRQGDSTWLLAYVRGQLTSIIDPSGVETRYLYSARGFLSAIVEPSGNTLRIVPNDGWTQVRYEDDIGLDREEQYDDLMHISGRIEPDGGVYRFESDALGRLVRATAPGSTPREYTYDAGGYLASATDGDGYRILIRHNVHGQIERITTPEGRTYECVWDTEGRLTAWVSPSGDRATFEYDAVGNETTIRHFDGRVETTKYDLIGRPVGRRLMDGTELGFVYDITDNVTRIHSAGVDLVLNEYDGEGRPLRTRTPDSDVLFEYGRGFRLVAEVQNGRRVEYAYSVQGAVISRTFAGSPLPALEFEWDRRMRLSALRRAGVTLQALSYNDKDQVLTRRFGECIERLHYNVAGSVVAQTVTRQGNGLLARAWTYDRRGNLATAREESTGESRYTIDGDHRLVESVVGDVVTRYSYDASGNLSGWDSGDRRWDYEYAPGNRLTRCGPRTYERDASGHVTRIIEADLVTSLSWNALGQLTEAVTEGVRITYAYDGLGRRTLRNANGVTTEFLWAGEQLLAEVTAGEVIEYLFDAFTPTTVWRGATMECLINSHLGVPLEAVSERGAVRWSQRLDDWGNIQHEQTPYGPLPLRFPGQQADEELGLHYNRFRYYDPRAGQYMSPDPQGLAAGANEYAYGPNPVNWIDPFGLSCGIPPGQHSVYVLEQGKRASPGPPPTPAIPPTPPVVIYVGITVQSPHARLAQHKGAPPSGVTPDGMRIIATGPPAVPDRTSARLLEASILNNAPPKGAPGGLNNAQRPVNPGYYHSNIPSSAPPGTTYLPATTTAPLLAPTNGTVIT